MDFPFESEAPLNARSGDGLSPYVGLSPHPIASFTFCKPKRVFVDTNHGAAVALDEDGQLSVVRFSEADQGGKMDNVIESWNVTLVRISPDERCLALRMEETGLRVKHRANNAYLSYSVRSGKYGPGRILGIEWMDDTTLLLIATSGVELLRLNLPKKQIKSAKSISIDIDWYKFSFASGLLFLCCAPNKERIRVVLVRPPKSLQKLYKFQMQSDLGDGKRVSVPIESNEFFLANMYNRLFAIHVDTRHSLASVYAVGRERLDFKHSFVLLPGSVEVSVVDNVLIFHNLDQKLVNLFDIRTFVHGPVVPPMCLAPHMGEGSAGWGAGELKSHGRPPGIEMYGESWSFVDPDSVFIADRNMLFRFEIDLESISLCFASRSLLVQFLMKRSCSKERLLSSLREAIEERDNLKTIEGLFNLINQVYHHSVFRGAGRVSDRAGGLPSPLASPGGLDSSKSDASYPPTAPQTPVKEGSTSMILSPASTGALSPDPSLLESDRDSATKVYAGFVVLEQSDVYEHVFTTIEESHALDFKYFLAVVTEYVGSLHRYRLHVQHYLHQFMTDLIIKNGGYFLLHQYLQYHVIGDSTPTAMQLISLSGEYPPTFQLALDMLQRLKEHSLVIDILLERQRVSDVINYCLSNRVKLQEPERLLEIAHDIGNPYSYRSAVLALRFVAPQFASLLEETRDSDLLEPYTVEARSILSRASDMS
eukprot:TRINITY_DN1135_c0_g1_i5.p1 TRINITY_DN1135_c0_g1~~TRINITY_DN1135_c0_g1_i5.p1  ORF type:complete len:732 (-),score=159.67 TRINITY_DN1135_c0_g1_i5:1868-3988(-)